MCDVIQREYFGHPVAVMFSLVLIFSSCIYQSRVLSNLKEGLWSHFYILEHFYVSVTGGSY